MGSSLKPLRIGPIQVHPPVILAPMAGYTDHAYRMICREMGAPYCVTEMMLDRLLMVKGRMRNRMLTLTEADHPIAGQLIGSEPPVMAEAALALGSMGFDVVDLNFACPVRKALSRQRGGYMMCRPEGVIEIIRAVVAGADRPVTVKLRQKFRTADDESNLWRILEAAFDAGVAAVCVHARSVEHKYFGPADWELLAEVKRRFPDRTIIGSGDVLSPQHALRMLQETGVDGAAAARGALGNPWFFRQVQELLAGREMTRPSIAEQRRVLTRHFAAACELYGAQKGPRIMRKFGIRYARMHPTPKAVRVAFVGVKKPQDWQAVLESLYPGLEGE
jgi:nifR3 family TIM-barrel protein